MSAAPIQRTPAIAPFGTRDDSRTPADSASRQDSTTGGATTRASSSKRSLGRVISRMRTRLFRRSRPDDVPRPSAVSPQLTTVLDALPEAVALFNEQNRLIATNARLIELIPDVSDGRTLIGISPRLLYVKLSPDASVVDQNRRRAIAALAPSSSEHDGAKSDLNAVHDPGPYPEPYPGPDAGPKATLSFELPSFVRSALLIKERRTDDGSLLVSVYGAPQGHGPGHGPGHGSGHGLSHGSSYTDPLTSLPNRTRLMRELALHCNRDDPSIALIIVDLCSFRQINDTYGRNAGDELLKQTALCLEAGMPDDALIARIAGDEFAVLLEFDVSDKGREAIERRVGALLTELSLGLNVNALNVPVRASVGIAYSPIHGNSVSTLMRSADSACAHAKLLSNNALVVFNSKRQQEAKHRHQLEVGLQQAIGRGELSLEYQPQMDVHSKMTCGMEALLRWNHPDFGRVSPADFIPIAEHTGIITRVGSWVLRQAMADYQRLARYGMSPAMLSVNLSRRQFSDGRIVHEIDALLDRSGFDPAKLCLEITETALFSDSSRIREMLRELTRLGARLAIDDFGVGYSSLLELRDFPIGEVKIDRAFVADVVTDGKSQDIIGAIVSIAESIGAEVVAEGIENQRQFEMISALGCDRAQGYWLCEPMSATTFPDVVLSA